MKALWDVLVFTATVGALGFLVWTIANVIEARRYLARVRRRNQPWFAVRVRFINQPLTNHSSKVLPYVPRTRSPRP